MNVQEIRLDLDKRVTVSERVVIGQGDKNGTTILAHVFDHGVAYDLTGKSAIFEMRLPRRTEYVRDGSCTVSGNTITYVVDEEHVAAVHGIADCAYFDILVGANVIASTARFSIDILQSAHDGAVPAESWDAAIDQLITRGNAQMDEYDAAERERADAEEIRNNSIITGADATLDTSAGTPSVSVTLDQPSALGRIIHFAFNHITGGGGTPDPIANSEIDNIVTDSPTTTTDRFLNAPGLSYLWGKIKTKVIREIMKNFAPVESDSNMVNDMLATRTYKKGETFVMGTEVITTTSQINNGAYMHNGNTKKTSINQRLENFMGQISIKRYANSPLNVLEFDVGSVRVSTAFGNMSTDEYGRQSYTSTTEITFHKTVGQSIDTPVVFVTLNAGTNGMDLGKFMGTASVKNVTPTGCTVQVHQYDSNPTGQFVWVSWLAVGFSKTVADI